MPGALAIYYKTVKGIKHSKTICVERGVSRKTSKTRRPSFLESRVPRVPDRWLRQSAKRGKRSRLALAHVPSRCAVRTQMDVYNP